MFQAKKSRPPRPPRSKEAIPNFNMPKFKEGYLFHGFLMNVKLLSDFNSGGPDDLKSDLRGRLRSLRQKIVYFFQEGDFFHGFLINVKLLSDFNLGGPDDLKSDLRGRLTLIEVADVTEAKHGMFPDFFLEHYDNITENDLIRTHSFQPLRLAEAS